MKIYPYRTFSRGFTLIELLVVIAIIGILSSVVLASLNTARNKGNNAGVQASFAQLRNEANIYYNVNGNFGTANTASGSCTTANSVFALDTTITKILGVIQTDSGHTPVCNSTIASDLWAAGVQLTTPIGSNGYLCVDSTGTLKGETSALGAATACP